MNRHNPFDLIVTICDADAVVIATTPRHLTHLGRDRDGVVGRCCREWVDPAAWAVSWAELQDCLGQGRPGELQRWVQGADGAIQRFLALKPLGSDLALCVDSAIGDAAAAASPSSAAAYIEAFAQELGHLSALAGLGILGRELDRLSGEATRAFQSRFL